MSVTVYSLEDTIPFLFFRRSADETVNSIDRKPSFKTKQGLEEDQDPFIRCTNCNYIITSSHASVAISGSHYHTFKNQAGIIYEIGCFSSARGCYNFGDPTLEYTWFPGYTWSISICMECKIHIGWYFQGISDHFYGLISNRLTRGK